MVDIGGQWVFGATSSLSLRRSALERILPIPAERWRLCADGAIAYPAAFLGKVVSLDEVLGSYRIHGSNNHYAAGLDPAKVQADMEMTNRYLNDFLERDRPAGAGRPGSQPELPAGPLLPPRRRAGRGVGDRQADPQLAAVRRAGRAGEVPGPVRRQSRFRVMRPNRRPEAAASI